MYDVIEIIEPKYSTGYKSDKTENLLATLYTEQNAERLIRMLYFSEPERNIIIKRSRKT